MGGKTTRNHSISLLFLTLGLTVENKYICEFTLKSKKLIVYADLATASAVVKNTWIYTSTPQYDSSILCLMKHGDIVASEFQDHNSGRLYTSCRHCSALQNPVVTSYSTSLKQQNIMRTVTQAILCFVWLSERTPVIALNSHKVRHTRCVKEWTRMKCVYCLTQLYLIVYIYYI